MNKKQKPQPTRQANPRGVTTRAALARLVDRGASRLDRREQQRAAERQAKAAKARESLAATIVSHREAVVAKANLIAEGAGLADGSIDRRRFLNVIVNRFDKHAIAYDPKTFNLFAVAKEAKHRIIGGVAPASVVSRQTKAEHLPPPKPPARNYPPGYKHPAAEQRAPTTFQDLQREREALRKRLSELGLQDPCLGAPGERPNGLCY